MDLSKNVLNDTKDYNLHKTPDLIDFETTENMTREIILTGQCCIYTALGKYF